MEGNETKAAKLQDHKAMLIPTAEIRPAMELHPFVDAFTDGRAKRFRRYKWLTAESLSMSFSISPAFIHSCLYNLWHIE